MSIAYRIDKELGVTFVVWDGTVTADEFLNHARRLRSDADWPPSRRQHLSDLRNAELDASIDKATLEAAADLYGSHPRIANLKVAIVAGQAFEKAVEFEHLISRYRPAVIVFNSLETACTWLGLDLAKAEHALGQLRGSTPP